ncbi:MAG TPA: ester cyclase [Acidimicrobiales bacterium]|nr:ester cyclase [Acidimicrobiales bacterium]
MAPTSSQRRESVVREHMASENEHRFDDTLATFAHPRYELVGTGQVYDGADEVRQYYARSRAVVPDQRNASRALFSGPDTVVVEFDLLGTHTGSLAGEEPSGRAFRCPMVALFEFEGDRIVCERVYFDSETIYRQLRGEGQPPGDG